MADNGAVKRERAAVLAAVGELQPADVNRAARAAVKKLTEDEQMLISDAVNALMRRLRSAGFTETMALELLAKVAWRVEAWGPGDAGDGPPH